MKNLLKNIQLEKKIATMESKNIIVTHSNSFHADEIVATALLMNYFFKNKELYFLQEEEVQKFDFDEDKKENLVYFIRTRDDLLLEKAKKDKGVFLLDVGGDYNEAQLNFDHHQRAFSKTWSDGTPFSTAGLIFEYLKNNQLIKMKNGVLEKFTQWIKSIDKHDNGIEASNFSLFISAYNRVGKYNTSLQQFKKAYSFSDNVISNVIHEYTAENDIGEQIKEAWLNTRDKSSEEYGNKTAILRVSNSFHNCSRMLKEISSGEADYIAIPGAGNRYTIKSVPLDDNPFSIKNPLPEQWRGREKILLETPEGRKIKLLFVHKSGYMCSLEGKRDDVVLFTKGLVDSRYLTWEDKSFLKHKLKPNL